jgi:hypothetical protein
LSQKAQLLSQTAKNMLQQAQQPPQQNGEELQCSASIHKKKIQGFLSPVIKNNFITFLFLHGRGFTAEEAVDDGYFRRSILLPHPQTPNSCNLKQTQREREMGQQENKRREREMEPPASVTSAPLTATPSTRTSSRRPTGTSPRSAPTLTSPTPTAEIRSDSDSDFGLILAVLGCQFAGFEMLG